MVLFVCLSHKRIRTILSTYNVKVAEMTKKNSPSAKKQRDEPALRRIPEKETSRNIISPAMVANKYFFDSFPNHSPLLLGFSALLL
jgi:hypothetical protein